MTLNDIKEQLASLGIQYRSIRRSLLFHSFPYLEVPVPTDQEALTISLATPKPFEVSRIVLRFNSFH
jgi:hypothetical protein